MENFVFNAIDTHELDEKPDTEKVSKYYIKIFGRTENNKSVYLRVDDYPICFYILIPEEYNSKTEEIKDKILQKLVKKHPYLEETIINNRIVKKQKLYGFNCNKKFNFLQLVFINKSSMFCAIKLLEYPIYINNLPVKFDIYEANIDPFLRFIHSKNKQSCGWLKILKKDLIMINEETTCFYNYSVDWKHVFPYENKNIFAPFNICSFDLECFSMDGSFPQAIRDGDKIIQIGMTFNNYGNNEINKKIIITLNTCDDIEDVEVISVKTEEELLLKFQEMVEREDPDILTGYNIFGFDIPYLMDRANYLKVNEKFYYLSKLKNMKCKMITKILSSDALGENKLNYINSIGRVNLDLMKIVQRDYKLSSYKLDCVAEYFIKDYIVNIEKINNLNNNYIIKSKNLSMLKINNYIRFENDHKKYKVIDINYTENYFIINDFDVFKLLEDTIYIENISKINKININDINDNINTINEIIKKNKLSWGIVKDDITPNQIFEFFEKESFDRKIIAEYCIQDCILVNKLIAKLEIITNNINMASVCYVPLHYILYRGQSIKSLSLIAKYAKENDILIPTLKYNNENHDDGYEGATVFNPNIGFHRKPIVVLDYNSLYPSSIISKNISHETYVSSAEYENLPEYTYHKISYKNNDGSINTCNFAQLKTNDEKKKYGIIPLILLSLLNERKKTKKEMEKENDLFKKKILDGKQLALKITANSIYGQLGASVSPIYFKEGAACTTAVGREMLIKARDFVNIKFKNIIYSLYVAKKENNVDEYNKILLNNINATDEFKNTLEILLNNIFDNFIISPKVIYGDSVMPYTPIILKIDEEIKIITIEDFSDYLIKNNHLWENHDNFKFDDLNINNKEKIEINNKIFIFTNNGWSQIHKIIRHKSNKAIYRINTNNSIVDVSEDHSLIDIDNNNITPNNIKSTTKLLHNFPKLCKINLELDEEEKIIINNQIEAQICYYYLKSGGYNVSILYTDTYYILSFNKNKNYKYFVDVKLLHKKNEYKGYIYDIETKEGNFQAGIGEIIVKNTDSIFINIDFKDKNNQDIFDKSTLQNSIELGKCISKFLKYILEYPQNMEYEKVLYPLALLEKKKYIANKYEDNCNEFTQIAMGVVLKRRDNPNIVKKVLGGIINIMLNENNIDKTIEFLEKYLNKIIKGKINITDFITSKTLKSSYKGDNLEGKSGEWKWTEVNTTQSHVCLAQKMRIRSPGNAPIINDRIPYVMIVDETKKKKTLQSEKIEHPDYIIEKNLKIDYLFYITNHIRNPVEQFLKLFLNKNKIETIFNTVINHQQQKNTFKNLAKYNILKSDNNNDNDMNNFENNIICNNFIDKNAKPNNITLPKNKNKIIKPITYNDKVFITDFE